LANLFYFGRMGLVIYKSSAGSGKTFTLVQQFLIKVIGQPWLFQRILAITFTNKATEELKTRIIKELDTLSKGLPSTQLDILLENLPKSTEEQLRNNAGIVLMKLLHDYSSFSVSTIDSYFQKLSRTLAKELLLPIRYEIELDTESICKNITELLLEDAGKDASLTKWLEDLLLHRIDSGKSWNIRSELNKMAKEVLNKDTVREVAAMTNPAHLEVLIKWIKSNKREIEMHLRKTGKDAMAQIHSNGYEVNTFFYKQRGPAGYLQKISDNKSSLEQFEKINTYTLKALDDPDAFLSKDQRKDQRLLSFVHDILHPLLKEATDYFETHKVKYISVLEASKLIYQSGISGTLDAKMKEYREKHQLFHLSDTTRMLSMSIAEQDAPFIYEKSGNTFLHIFIDEFQDTATVQWNILKPLILNSLSTGNDVLLVGDAKQSIYRWRGGNMQLILDGISNELKRYGIKPTVKNLDTNWRSKREIVAFNNAFFPLAATLLRDTFESGNEIFDLAYATKEVHQHIKNKESDEGYLCFKFFKTEKGEEQEEEQHWKMQALETMSVNIKELLENGYTYGDIVILVRTNKDENEIADFLFEKGEHPFISGNSLLISTNTKINVLLNCMRLIAESDEPLLHAEINHFVDQDINYLNEPIPFNVRSPETKNNSWVHRNIIKEKEKLSTLPLQFIFLHLLDITKMDVTDPFIQKFGDLLQDYAGSRNSNLSGFLQWYDEHVSTRKWSVELPDGGNAIRIITIHRSKGLEFPVVFIPFMNWEYTPSIRSMLWAHSDEEEFTNHSKIPLYATGKLEESYFKEDYIKESLETAIDNLNLIYVAFTRPKDQLYVFGPAKTKENQVGKLLFASFSQNPEWAEQFAATDYNELIIGNKNSKKSSEKKSGVENIYEPSGFTPAEIPVLTENKYFLPEIKYIFSSDEILFGNLVHDTIATVNNKNDIDHAINKVFSKNGNQGYIKWREKLIAAVQELWQLLEERGWTNEDFEIENEIEICDEKGLIHRPDKVLIKGDTAIVIDFKTGKKEEPHKNQIKEYCRLIQSTGIKTVSAYLIYTTDKEIVSVL
jgi:ATP-dependent helicase/nuclease subunit A